MDEAAGWLDRLPDELSAQRELLGRFLDWGQRDDDVRWLTVGCSLERGNADWMSDLDIAMHSPSTCRRPAMGSPLVHSGARMPPAIDKSIPGPSLNGVLGAARYLAVALVDIQHLLSSKQRYELPDDFAAFVCADLAHANGHGPPVA